MIYEINMDTSNEKEQNPQLIETNYIRDTLSIYNPEHIYLESAKWQYPELEGHFRIEHYVFTKKNHIDYVTASMVMLYLSQLGYVFTRIFCDEDLLPPGFVVSSEEFCHLRDIGNIVFLGFDKLRFKKRIPVAQKALDMRISVSKFHVPSSSLLVGDISFDINTKVIAGYTKVAIILDRG